MPRYFRAVSDSSNTISLFAKAKLIKLTHSGALTDYQCSDTFDYEPAMLNNFDDIRFTTQSGEHIPYWIETKTDGVSAKVWFMNDYVDGDTYIWMYYGSAGLSSGSSISDMSVDGSDFTDLTGWTQQAGSWSVSSGILQIPESGGNNYYLKRNAENPLNTDYIVRSRFKIDENTTGESNHRLMILLNSSTPLLRSSGNDIVFYEQYVSTQYNRLVHDFYGTSTYTNISNYPAHTWLKSEIRISDAEDKITLWSDDLQTNYGNHTTSNTKDGGDYWGIHSSYSKGEIDWIFIRKYTAVEPTVTVGAEQHPKTGDMMIL